MNILTQKKQKKILKYNFLIMTETLKEKMKNSLKEIEEKTNKKV